MRSLQANEHGAAMFMALFLMAAGLAIVCAITEYAFENSRGSRETLAREQAFFAAVGVADLVVSDIWGAYLAQRSTGEPNFRTWVLANSSRFKWSGLIDGATVTATQWNALRFGDSQISKVKLTRNDHSEANGNILITRLTVAVEATADSGIQVWVSRVIRTNCPADYHGFDFGVLTNNITCTVCHMRVQNLAKAFNTSPTMYGKFDRVKVGTLQLLGLRSGSEPTSRLEGTLYQRGRFEEEFSGTAENVAWLNSTNFKCTTFNASQATIAQNSTTGAVTPSSWTNAPVIDATAGTLAPLGNLYLNYPTDQTVMDRSDGDLPTEFPSPFTDWYNPSSPTVPLANRKVDSQEVTGMMSSDKDKMALGTLSCAKALTVNKATGMYNYTQLPDGASGAPAASSLALDQTASTTPYSNHVVLVGTPTDPIRVNGKVVIDGDVMIRGYVEGEGQIWATGNIYAPGDVRYNNATDASGNEIFGTSPSGNNNLVALVAGGSIVVGDYLSTVQHWDSSKTGFFEYGQPERGKRYSTTSPATNQLPDTSSLNGPTDAGSESYLNVDLNGDGDKTDTFANVNFANFVMEELAIFNQQELTRTLTKVPTGTPSTYYWAKSGASGRVTDSTRYTTTNPIFSQFNDTAHSTYYTPRYYTLYPNTTRDWGAQNSLKNTPPPVYLNDENKFDTTKNWWNNTQDPHTYNSLRTITDIPMQQAQCVSQAVTTAIHPEWITPGTMLALLIGEEQKRQDAYTTTAEPRRLDGLLYTNNAVFAIERKQTQYPTNGTYWDTTTQTWKRPGNLTPTFAKEATESNGCMVVNGAIVAPDMGILVTGGTKSQSTAFKYSAPVKNGSTTTYELDAFNLNYDSRVRYLINLDKTAQVFWGAPQKMGFGRAEGPLP